MTEEEETQEETKEEVTQEVTQEEPTEEKTETPVEVAETTESTEETVEEATPEAPAEQANPETEQVGDPRYNTVNAEEIKYGTNNFIEVARKKVEDAEFISISKGYYTKRGTRRYKNGLGFPDEAGIKKFLIEKLQNI
jgi:glucan-binding YG repeat protein